MIRELGGHYSQASDIRSTAIPTATPLPRDYRAADARLASSGATAAAPEALARGARAGGPGAVCGGAQASGDGRVRSSRGAGRSGREPDATIVGHARPHGERDRLAPIARDGAVLRFSGGHPVEDSHPADAHPPDSGAVGDPRPAHARAVRDPRPRDRCAHDPADHPDVDPNARADV